MILRGLRVFCRDVFTRIRGHFAGMSSVSLRGHFAGSLPHSWIQLVGGLPSIAPAVPHLLRLLHLRSSYDMFISSHLHVSHAVHVPLVTTDVERTHTAAGGRISLSEIPGQGPAIVCTCIPRLPARTGSTSTSSSSSSRSRSAT